MGYLIEMVLYKIITEYFTTSTTSIMFSKVGWSNFRSDELA